MADPQLNNDFPSPDDESAYPVRRPLIQSRLPYALLLAVCYLLGLYCCELNRQLYQHQSPFYDSLSYNEKLFSVMTVSREYGLLESLDLACFTDNTNCLPFLAGAVAAPFVEPSRSVGIWFQIGLFFAFLASLFHYLSSIRRLSTSSSLAGCFVFLAAQFLYFENGGLSDFRMDMFLFIGFGLTALWYLSSMSRPSDWNFVLLGVSAAICCLLRATAPVYLIFALTPLFVGELLKPRRAIKLRGIAISATIVVVLTGWFYILNFDYLRFYYVEWNTDANAEIPLSRTFTHAKFTLRSIGEPTLIMLIFWWCGVSMGIRKEQTLTSWIGKSIRSGDIDLRIFWLGIAAIVLMILRRAGLNPYVCMPAVFGLILFLALPCLRQLDILRDKSLTSFCWSALLVCVVISCARGWHRHSSHDFNSMQANHLIIDTMVENARTRNKANATYGVVQITTIGTNNLYSVLLFDRPEGEPHVKGVVLDGINFRRSQTFLQAAKTDWKMLAGSTDAEKIAGMVAEAESQIDFLIVPDKESANSISLEHQYNVVNIHLVGIRELIANSESWGLVKSRIQVDEEEFVEIYRNLKRD